MKNTTKTLLICAASLMMSANMAFAQVAPALTPDQQTAISGNDAGAELNQRLSEIARETGKREAYADYQNRELDDGKNGVAPKRDVPEVKLSLKKLEFTESKILSKEFLDSIAEKYECKDIVIGDLYKVMDEINAEYSKKGYLVAKAILKPQKIADGEVLITLIEGKAGKVSVTGNKVTKTKYIENYFRIKDGDYPNFNEIKHDMQYFNNTNSTKLQIKMVPGKEERTTDIYIVAGEPEKTGKINLFADNYGKETTGEYRYGINYADSNLSGYCDNLVLSGVFTKTSETAMANYSIPVDGRGNRVGMLFSTNHMRISDGNLKFLDVRGNSEVAGLNFSHPFLSTANRRNKITFGVQQQHSETTVMGFRFVHDDNRRYNVAYDSLLFRKSDLLYYRPSFSYTDYSGIGMQEYTTKFNLDAMWQKFIKNGNTLTLTLSGQKSFDDTISSADKMYAGGVYSVRGYDESILCGESGVNIKADYAWKTKIKGLRILTFFDFASVSGDSAYDTKNIYSAGYGLEYRKDQLSMTATVGHPLRDKVNGVKVDDSQFNFTLNYQF